MHAFTSRKAIIVLVRIAYEGQFSKFAIPEGIETLKPTHKRVETLTRKKDAVVDLPYLLCSHHHLRLLSSAKVLELLHHEKQQYLGGLRSLSELEFQVYIFKCILTFNFLNSEHTSYPGNNM